ncbi:hypothetical protein INT46_011903 [Mucor plumbeus]|jgi:hypothetical protein|uniref:Uncharacterized protein n=1 Tax=Mucor plumbeus TaxID=97098 RepID=A0A8H7V8I2_9FUNG|nr:hypothetical protein INT46_011903 [Mucor plumbeus]
MLLSKIALSVLAIAGVCSASDRFLIRSPTSSRLLGFSYEKKPFFGGKCTETYDKYLKVQSSGKGVHFKLTGCDDDNYCHLAITDGDYKGYCLSGDKRPESESCDDENNIYKVNLDLSISAKDGTYLGLGNEYKDDCADFQYVELTKEKYHWLIDHDKDFNGQDYEDEEVYDDYYDYPYHPRGGQRIFHHCRE